MTIKMKLIIVTLAIVVSSIVNFSLTAYVEHQIVKYQASEKNALHIKIDILELRKYEKDFLARKDVKYVQKFEKMINTIKADIQKEIDFLISENMDTSKISDFSKMIEEYHKTFIKLVEHKVIMGLNPKDGLYGELREAVHKIQDTAKDADDTTLLTKVLTLRKHEKDFLLRNSTKYIDKFEADSVKLEKCLIKKFDEKPNSELLLKNLAMYKKAFTALTNAQIAIGLDSSSGVMGKMRSAIHKSEESLETFEKEFIKLTDEYITGLEKMTIIIEIIIMLLIIGFVLILAKSIVDSLCKLEKTAKDLAQGEGDLTQRLEIKGSDEIARVSNYINDFIEKVQNTIIQAKETSNENSSVAEELSRTSLQIGQKAEEESVIVGEVSSQGKELQGILNVSIDNAKVTESELDNAENSLNNANGLIVTLADNINERSQAEAELAEQLSTLSADASQVKAVLEVIGDIADQTNLLALNAAIEAARAGEHGRGFAVVADEVRKLAERTQKSLVEINSTISVIVQSINDASGAISHNASEIEKLSSNANTVQNEISGSVQIMEVAVKKVDEMVEGYVENGVMIQKMIDKVEVVNDLSISNARSVEEIASASDHLSSMTAKLNGLLASYKS